MCPPCLENCFHVRVVLAFHFLPLPACDPLHFMTNVENSGPKQDPQDPVGTHSMVPHLWFSPEISGLLILASFFWAVLNMSGLDSVDYYSVYAVFSCNIIATDESGLSSTVFVNLSQYKWSLSLLVGISLPGEICCWAAVWHLGFLSDYINMLPHFYVCMALNFSNYYYKLNKLIK